MAKYTSPATVVARSAEELAAKFADFTTLQAAMDNMDAAQRAKVGDVSFTNDSIRITTPQVGEIVLRAVERSAERIRLQAENSPVPMSLIVDLKPVDAGSTEVTGTIEVDIPAMLRPMVGPTLQKAADQFGNLFAGLA